MYVYLSLPLSVTSSGSLQFYSNLQTAGVLCPMRGQRAEGSFSLINGAVVVAAYFSIVPIRPIHGWCGLKRRVSMSPLSSPPLPSSLQP